MGNQWHLFFRVHVYVNTLHDESKPKAHYKYIRGGGGLHEKKYFGVTGGGRLLKGGVFSEAYCRSQHYPYLCSWTAWYKETFLSNQGCRKQLMIFEWICWTTKLCTSGLALNPSGHITYNYTYGFPAALLLDPGVVMSSPFPVGVAQSLLQFHSESLLLIIVSLK